jgi:hypothetical protein
MFLTINDIPLWNIDQSVVLMETSCVLCEVRSGSLPTDILFNADRTISYDAINILKPNGNFTYDQVQHSRIMHADYIAFVCFVWLSGKKERLLPYTPLTDWFL